jgi:hypothetical protein
MSEWFKERAWKVRIRQKRIQGSNPCLSATIISGEVAEWSIVLDSKSSVPPGTVGSNPTLSALKTKGLCRILHRPFFFGAWYLHENELQMGFFFHY